jgi:hypothetical protein
MGNMTTAEKIGISIIAIVYRPFMLVGDAIRFIGRSTGLFDEQRRIGNSK